MLSVLFVQPGDSEFIIGSVSFVTVNPTPLGKTVVAHLLDDKTWTFGPVSPMNPNPNPRVYVMNETGQTISQIVLEPGPEAAWAATVAEEPAPDNTMSTGILAPPPEEPVDPKDLGRSTLQPAQ